MDGEIAILSVMSMALQRFDVPFTPSSKAFLLCSSQCGEHVALDELSEFNTGDQRRTHAPL